MAAPKPKENEALVQVTAIGVNFIDVYNREGRYPAPLPLIPGQEAAGTVKEVGAKVTEVKIVVTAVGRIKVDHVQDVRRFLPHGNTLALDGVGPRRTKAIGASVIVTVLF